MTLGMINGSVPCRASELIEERPHPLDALAKLDQILDAFLGIHAKLDRDSGGSLKSGRAPRRLGRFSTSLAIFSASL